MLKGCKKCVSIIIIFLIVVTAIVTINFSNAAVAYAAPMPPLITEQSGIVFSESDIKIDTQVLNIKIKQFSVRRTIALVEKTYTIINTSQNSINTAVLFFISGAWDFGIREFCVAIDDTIIFGTTTHFLRENLINTHGLQNWRQILENPILEYHTKQTTTAASFYVFLEPNQTATIAIRYTYSLEACIQNTQSRTLWYLITPERYWNNGKNLIVNLSLEKGHLANSSVRFTRHNAREYSLNIDNSSVLEFRISISRRPRGFAFLQAGNVGLFFLSFLPILALIAAFILSLLAIIKSYKNKRISNKSKILWILFLVFLSTMILFVAIMPLTWIATANGWLIVYFSIMLAPTFLLSATTFALAIVVHKKESC